MSLTLSSNVLQGVGIGADTNGGFWVAWGQLGGGIGLAAVSEAGSVTHFGTAFTNALPIELRMTPLTDSTSTCFLATWTEGGDAREIIYGVLNEHAQPRIAPRRLTANTRGVYSSLSVVAGSNWTARVTAQYAQNPVEIRSFDIHVADGVNVNDADGDQFNDALELLIIDADLSDSVKRLSDVSPEGDFDGDGLSNFAEFHLGLDPTDAASTLNISDFATTNGVDIGFVSSDSIDYDIQTHTSLVDGAGWSNIQSVLGDGFYIQINCSNDLQPNRFYRLKTDVPEPTP